MKRLSRKEKEIMTERKNKIHARQAQAEIDRFFEKAKASYKADCKEYETSVKKNPVYAAQWKLEGITKVHVVATLLSGLNATWDEEKNLTKLVDHMNFMEKEITTELLEGPIRFSSSCVITNITEVWIASAKADFIRGCGCKLNALRSLI